MLGFLIALAAGAATPMVETPLARPVARFLAGKIAVQDTELRLIAFMVALIIAGLLSAVFHSGSPLGLAIGASLGYFAARLIRWGQAAVNNRR